MSLKSLSKFLSYVLRHHPESIDLSVDENGWAEISELVDKAEQHGKSLTIDSISEITKHGRKQRFIISEDGLYIRAGYGHSIDVDLQLKPENPPSVLYHGTAKQNAKSILEEGIKPGSRNFVHLSTTRDEARNVGGRHGSPVILTVNAAKMDKNNFHFYQSESEPSIWLTKKVPPEYVAPDIE